MEEVFYMVYVEGGSVPTVIHKFEDNAVKEAKELSEKHLKKTFVLRSVKAITSIIKSEISDL